MPAAVTVRGVADITGRLNQLAREAPQLVDGAAEVTAYEVRRRLQPTRRTGRLLGSVRATKAPKATVTIGGGRAPHAPFHEYGARSFPGVHALRSATTEATTRTHQQAETDLHQLTGRLNLT